MSSIFILSFTWNEDFCPKRIKRDRVHDKGAAKDSIESKMKKSKGNLKVEVGRGSGSACFTCCAIRGGGAEGRRGAFDGQ